MDKKRADRKRKAISSLIAYVLLIGMTIAMAGAVYAWLHFYVLNPLPAEKCPAEISIVIYDHNCSEDILTLTIQNRGNFNISGYIAKINNESGGYGIAGKYPLCKAGYTTCDNRAYPPGSSPLPPLGNFTESFNYSNYTQITMIEIEPFRLDAKGYPVF
jgi:flagellin-like protein